MNDSLLATLKRWVPRKVRVYNSDDETRDVAVPERRRKWESVMNAIEARPWVRCELLDKSGAVLAYVENDGPAGDIEDISGAGATKHAEFDKYLRTMLDAQKVALSYRDAEHKVLLSSMVDILKANTDAMKQLAQLYQAQVNVAADVAAMQATAEAGGDMEQWLKLAEAAPASIAQLVPLIRLLTSGKKPSTEKPKPAPPNGAPKNGVS